MDLFKIKAKIKYVLLRFHSNLEKYLRILWVVTKSVFELIISIAFIVFAVYFHSWIANLPPSNINQSLPESYIVEITKHWGWGTSPFFEFVLGVHNTILFNYGLDPINGNLILPIVLYGFAITFISLYGALVLLIFVYKNSFEVKNNVTIAIKHEHLSDIKLWSGGFIVSLVLTGFVLYFEPILHMWAGVFKQIVLLLLMFTATGIFMSFNGKFSEYLSTQELVSLFAHQLAPLIISLSIIFETLIRINGIGYLLFDSLFIQNTPVLFGSFYLLGLLLFPLRIFSGAIKIEKREIDDTSSRVISTYLG